MMAYHKYSNCNCCGYFCATKRSPDSERSIPRASLHEHIDLWNTTLTYNPSFCSMPSAGGDYDCDSSLQKVGAELGKEGSSGLQIRRWTGSWRQRGNQPWPSRLCLSPFTSLGALWVGVSSCLVLSTHPPPPPPWGREWEMAGQAHENQGSGNMTDTGELSILGNLMNMPSEAVGNKNN